MRSPNRPNRPNRPSGGRGRRVGHFPLTDLPALVPASVASLFSKIDPIPPVYVQPAMSTLNVQSPLGDRGSHSPMSINPTVYGRNGVHLKSSGRPPRRELGEQSFAAGYIPIEHLDNETPASTCVNLRLQGAGTTGNTESHHCKSVPKSAVLY